MGIAIIKQAWCFLILIAIMPTACAALQFNCDVVVVGGGSAGAAAAVAVQGGEHIRDVKVSEIKGQKMRLQYVRNLVFATVALAAATSSAEKNRRFVLAD